MKGAIFCGLEYGLPVIDADIGLFLLILGHDTVFEIRGESVYVALCRPVRVLFLVSQQTKWNILPEISSGGV